MEVLTQIVVWLSAVANWIGTWVLVPIGLLPGWVSATVIAVVTGLVMLVIFKHTSNQKAIKAARDDIKAQLLAMKLFKENVFVTLKAQGRILLGAGRLIFYGLAPTVVMAVPVTLALAQLGLWYQARPLLVGEEAVLTMTLNGESKSAWPKVSLMPNQAIEIENGPVRALSKRQICWNLRARTPGDQRLVFQVDDKEIDKELAIGDGFMRVSTERPGWTWDDILLNPREKPFGPDSPVKSITIKYQTRSSWIYGTDSWVIYWFAVSLVAAFFCRGLLGVNV